MKNSIDNSIATFVIPKEWYNTEKKTLEKTAKWVKYFHEEFNNQLGLIDAYLKETWFTSILYLILDHKKLKQQIKSWENRMDIINNVLVDYQQEQIIWWNNPVQSDVEEILHEMTAVNI